MRRIKFQKLFIIAVAIFYAGAQLLWFSDNGGSNWKIRPAYAAPGSGMHLFWDGGAAPAGWTLRSESGNDFYQKFIRGDANASVGGTGGQVNHTHTSATRSASTTGQTTSTTTSTNVLIARNTHLHSASAPSVTTNDNLPRFNELQVISCDSGVPNTLPDGVIAMFDTATMPPNWTQYSAENGYFVRGGASGALSSGGATTHNHTINITLSNTSNLLSIQGQVGGTSFASSNHGHPVCTVRTSDFSNDPPHIEVVFAKKDASKSAGIPDGMIAMFGATPDSNTWTSLSESGGAFYQVIIEGQAAYSASPATGNTYHDHGNNATVACAATQQVCVAGRAGASTAGSNCDHTHSILVNIANVTGLWPPYINMVIAKKVAYAPTLTKWRVYADEASTTPSTAYAAEGTAPPTAENGLNIRYKLRVNLTNTGGDLYSSRKKLFFKKNGAGGTQVTEQGSTDGAWRYANCGGADNGTLDGVVLSTSDATTKGIYDESNSVNPTNSNHPYNKTVEWEYCIEPNGLNTGTYTFFLQDEVTQSGTTFITNTTDPTIQITDVSLSDLSPSSVFLGTKSAWPHNYTFQAGEEITGRDNRGLASPAYTTSSGWTLSAILSTLLTSGGNTINPDYMWFTTNTITGLYVAPTTGITGSTNVTMGRGDGTAASFTVMTVSGSGYNGLGGFTVLPTIKIDPGGSTIPAGDYAGVLTLTII